MISVLTPTRNRLERLKEMMTSAFSTAKAPIELVLYVDEDKETKAFLEDRKLRIMEAGHHLQILTGPKRRLSQYWNDCAEAAKGDILMLANDDIVFRSQDWAIRVEEAFERLPKKLGVVYTNNGQPNAATFSTHPFIHRNWMKAVGYFVPPVFAGDFTDTWIWDVATKLEKTIYLPDLMIEHLHYSTGKVKTDQTYEERITSEDGMHSLYEGLFRLRELDAERLKVALQ